MAEGEKSRSGDMVWGFHAVESLLEHDASRVLEVVLAESRHDRRMIHLKRLLQRTGLTVRNEERVKLDAMAPGKNHQGVIAVLSAGNTNKSTGLAESLKLLEESALVLVLDHIQDPHNLGACLRSAAGAGADLVIMPRAGACPVNDTVRKVAAGAVELVEICRVANLNRAIESLKAAGFWIYGAADDGDVEIYGCSFAGKIAVVMGEEGTGMRKLTRSRCDFLVSIPMHSGLASLNVSVATGVFLFEVRRQLAGITE